MAQFPEACELRNGKGCSNTSNCGLRTRNQRCRYAVMPTDAQATGTPAANEPGDTPLVTGTVTVGPITVGVKL